MSNGYTHGRVDCRLCFTGDEPILILNDWRLHNNPGYYGSSTPKFLVLGFSKGATQDKVAEQGDFDRIAFAGFRSRLQTVLETLDIMPENRGVDELLTAHEKDFGFASLIRCSLCKIKGDSCITSGNIINSSFKDNLSYPIINRCAMTYLARLPESIHLVILLGTNDSYIDQTRQLFQKIYLDFRSINPVAFRAGGSVWIYAAHPSPANGHLSNWVNADESNSSGYKRLLALQAIQSARS